MWKWIAGCTIYDSNASVRGIHVEYFCFILDTFSNMGYSTIGDNIYIFIFFLLLLSYISYSHVFKALEVSPLLK